MARDVRVLAVDDQEVFLRACSRLVAATDGFCWAGAAASGPEALERLEDLEPDLVLMDVVLPGMSGFQATRALTRDEATSRIPVLIVSTKSMETDRAWGMRQGAVDYIVKPPRQEELLERIKQLVNA